MAMEQALRKRLLEDAAVKALVVKRVDWGPRKQGAPLPAITLSYASARRDQHMKGNAKFNPTRVQLDVWGSTRDDVATLREAAIAALLPGVIVSGTEFLRAFVNNIIDRGEDLSTGFLHRDLVDITIWHD